MTTEQEANLPLPVRRTPGSLIRLILILLWLLSIVGLLVGRGFLGKAQNSYATIYSSLAHQAQLYAGHWLPGGAGSGFSNVFIGELQISAQGLQLNVQGQFLADGTPFNASEETFLGSPFLTQFSDADNNLYNLSLSLKSAGTLRVVVTDTSGNSVFDNLFVKSSS
jgi:hypothetical protein